MRHEKGPGCFSVAQWPVWAAKGPGSGAGCPAGSQGEDGTGGHRQSSVGSRGLEFIRHMPNHLICDRTN